MFRASRAVIDAFHYRRRNERWRRRMRRRAAGARTAKIPLRRTSPLFPELIWMQ